jgi:hypothetical protein
MNPRDQLQAGDWVWLPPIVDHRPWWRFWARRPAPAGFYRITNVTASTIRLEEPDMTVNSHPQYAICPSCKHPNNMPAECLRHEWQSEACSRCQTPYEYRGVQTGGKGDDYAIETREPFDLPQEAAQLTGHHADTVVVDDPNEEGAKPSSPLWASPTGADALAYGLSGLGKAGGRSAASEKIGRASENDVRSDSSKKYRRWFVFGPDVAERLAAAVKSNEVNGFWADLGGKGGFVWTTVMDLREVGPGGPLPEAATPLTKDGRAWLSRFDFADPLFAFTAQVEDEQPGNAEFDRWMNTRGAAMVVDRQYMQRDLAREAWEAGSRHAATSLALMDPPPKREPLIWPVVLGYVGGLGLGLASFSAFIIYAVLS